MIDAPDSEIARPLININVAAVPTTPPTTVAPTTTLSPTLPPTGSDSTQTGLLIGAGLLGLGGLMVVVAYRRRQEPTTA